MPDLPARFAALTITFAPLFVQRSWPHARVLLVGAILVPGRRMVASVPRIAGAAVLTQHRVSEKRGAMPDTLRGGVIVHDHFKPYLTQPDVAHALCNAHHLRELKALIDIEKEPWARKMSRLLVRAAKRAERAIAQGRTALARRCGARGRAPRRVGHHSLERLRVYKTEVLRFMSDFAVPFTNDQAEQDIRMMKVKMKISGGFRTWAGAESFATLRAALSTARKQGLGLLQALTTQPAILIQHLSG